MFWSDVEKVLEFKLILLRIKTFLCQEENVQWLFHFVTFLCIFSLSSSHLNLWILFKQNKKQVFENLVRPQKWMIDFLVALRSSQITLEIERAQWLFSFSSLNGKTENTFFKSINNLNSKVSFLMTKIYWIIFFVYVQTEFIFFALFIHVHFF